MRRPAYFCGFMTTSLLVTGDEFGRSGCAGAGWDTQTGSHTPGVAVVAIVRRSTGPLAPEGCRRIPAALRAPAADPADDVLLVRPGRVYLATASTACTPPLPTALEQGTTKLVAGRGLVVCGNRLTLSAATLTRLVGNRSYGVNATVQAEFSQGVPGASR